MLRRVAQQWVPGATVVAVLLAVAPSLESPFHQPKEMVVVVAAALSALLLLAVPRRESLVAAALGLAAVLAWFGPAAQAGPSRLLLAAGVLLFTFSTIGLDARAVGLAAALGGGLSALVAVAQGFNLDPFNGFAPDAHGRLVIFGTLGNPDFVAGALSVTVCLSAGAAATAEGRLRWALWGSVVAQVAALAFAQSFTTPVALFAAGLFVLFRARRFALPVALVGLGAVVVVSGAVVGRSLHRALEGRAYLTQVVAPHLFDRPLQGLGPGAVEQLWPLWEVDFWQAQCGQDQLCVRRHPWREFAALQNHAHDDYLERLIEGGVPGLLALLWVAGVALKRAFARPQLDLAGPALVTLLVRAAVDFPLARPAELCLLSVVLALCLSPASSKVNP